MQECIPHKTLPPRHNLPWLSKRLVQLIKKRNQLFSQAKRSKREVDLINYRKMHSRVFSRLRSAKAKYFKRFNPHDAKQFWKPVKYLNKVKSSIPVLTKGDVTAHSDKGMIIEYFTTRFNQNIPPLGSWVSPDLGTLHPGHTQLVCMTRTRSSFALLKKSSIF